ncbi:cysteine hydrolase family protein [Oceanobacillus manasiensis]|uniref:cysteine hydrolase family protein n=1 Tax=Oceanobacillus manasiensis TaxID=586413 RepID=UPI0005AB1364|nr:isochorismatase family protein [Oceanobacillus manasiensis]
MKALFVIDVQNGIVENGDFTEELEKMEQLIKDFKQHNEPVIFFRHLDTEKESALYEASGGADLHDSLRHYADYIVEKRTPSGFFRTDLEELLKENQIEHVVITGFNTEFCCMFTAIAAYDRGYKVTFIEDATGTLNNGETYEMNDLDIRDFVATVLHWSEAIEVLDYEEYWED